MNARFDDNKNKIVEELKKHISSFECPVCKHKEFQLVGGYFAHDLQQDLKNRQIGGISIPTVPIICKNCGFVAEFAAGALGLLPKKDDKSSSNARTRK